MTNNGYDPSGILGGQGMQPSSGISFQKGALDTAGGKVKEQTDTIELIQEGSKGLSVPFPHFGVVGLGVHNIHEKAIQAQEQALQGARDALATWQPALKKADDNYREADELPKVPGPEDMGTPKIPGAGDLPGAGKLPNAGDLGKIPDGKLPDGTLPGSDLPGNDLPGTDLPGSDLPGTDLPGSDLPGTDLPGTDVPGANTPTVPDPNGSQPNVPITDPADMKVPDINSALNDPSKTDLSQYQPTNPSLNTPSLNSNVPNPSNFDPSAPGTRTAVPNTYGGGPGTGMGPGSNGLPTAHAAAMRGAAGAGGMPMMPMMPMGGGAAGGQDNDREKTVGLSEDEGVWMSDEDIAPQVIGLEEQ